MSDHIQWTRYARARACVHRAYYLDDSNEPEVTSIPSSSSRDVDLTLGIEHDGALSITALPGSGRAVSGESLFTLELTLKEAERLRDLLVWALADLPGTLPPPR